MESIVCIDTQQANISCFETFSLCVFSFFFISKNILLRGKREREFQPKVGSTSSWDKAQNSYWDKAQYTGGPKNPDNTIKHIKKRPKMPKSIQWSPAQKNTQNLTLAFWTPSISAVDHQPQIRTENCHHHRAATTITTTPPQATNDGATWTQQHRSAVDSTMPLSEYQATQQ